MVRRSLSGPKAQYRGKLRGRPVSVLLTDLGHALLLALTTRHRLSRSDVIEGLLRGDLRGSARLAPRGREE